MKNSNFRITAVTDQLRAALPRYDMAIRKRGGKDVTREFTGYYDRDGQKLYVGDSVKDYLGRRVVVEKTLDSYYIDGTSLDEYPTYTSKFVKKVRLSRNALKLVQVAFFCILLSVVSFIILSADRNFNNKLAKADATHQYKAGDDIICNAFPANNNDRRIGVPCKIITPNGKGYYTVEYKDTISQNIVTDEIRVLDMRSK